MLALIIVLLFPIYWMLISSLGGESQFAFPPKFLPTHPSAISYIQIFTQKPLGAWLLNSTVVSLASTGLSIAVSAPAAFVLSRFRSAGLTGFSIAILVTQMLPATLLVIQMYFLFRILRLLDSLAGLVLVYTAFAIPLSVWILRGFFDTIPRDLEESAKIEYACPDQYAPSHRHGWFLLRLGSFRKGCFHTRWNQAPSRADSLPKRGAC